MPTLVTKTVKSSGGDYTSLSAWEAAQQGDIVAADEIREAECYSFEDTSAVVIDGWTTDATRFARVRVADGERHDGKRDTSKYRLYVNAGFGGTVLTVLEAYTRLEGLQISHTGTGSCLSIEGVAAVRVTDTLAYDSANYGFRSSGTGQGIFNNCVAINCDSGGFINEAGGTTDCYWFNCVAIAGAGDGFTGNTGFGRVSEAKNCYAGGNGGADYNDAGGLSITTSFSEDGSASTSTAAYSTSSGAYFTNVTAGSEDIHIGTSSSLKDAGTDLSGDSFWLHPGGNVDIDGNTRSTWDVGADEYESGAVSETPTPGGATAGGAAPTISTAITAGGSTAQGNPATARIDFAPGGSTAGGGEPTSSTTLIAGGSVAAGNTPAARVDLAAGGATAAGNGPSALAGVSPGGATAGGAAPTDGGPVSETPTPGGSAAGGFQLTAAAAVVIHGATAAGNPITLVLVPLTSGGAVAGGQISDPSGPPITWPVGHQGRIAEPTTGRIAHPISGHLRTRVGPLTP